VNSYVARQPIYDRTQEVVAYELLFHSGPEAFCGSLDLDRASTSVISDSLHVFANNELTGGKPAWIDVSRNTLVRGFALLLPPGTTVIQIRDLTDIDSEVVEACRGLRQAGYTISIDLPQSHEQFESLLPLVDVVRVLSTASISAEHQALRRRLAPRGMRFIADNVGTRQEFLDARNAGCDLFLGRFAMQGEVVASRAIPAGKLTTLTLIQQLSRPDLNRTEVEDTIQRDPGLTLKLLRYLNSAFFALPTRVESIKHAVSLLGDGPLRTWASLIAMGSLADAPGAELVVTGLVRARFCEVIGKTLDCGLAPSELFLLGMVSTFDALLEVPIQKVLRTVKVSRAIDDALLGAEGDMTRIFQLTLAIESGNWSRVSTLTRDLGVGDGIVAGIYREAILWADRVNQF